MHQPLPKLENKDSHRGNFESSVWVDFDFEALSQGESWLLQFDRRHVVVTGTLESPDPEYGGCGHMSLWPAAILVNAISKKRS